MTADVWSAIMIIHVSGLVNYKVSDLVIIKIFLQLIFILQLYVSVESIPLSTIP